MSQFKFVKAKAAYGMLYFQFPKVLMYGDKYRNLSGNAKIAYMLLKARLELSIRNNWIDEEGNVFFNYTIKDLMNLLNCGNQKVNSIKHELENASLLFQKQMGVNKPNRLYLAELEVGPQDIYQFGDDNVPRPDSAGYPVPEPPTDSDAPLADPYENDDTVINHNNSELDADLMEHLTTSLNNAYSTTIFDNAGLKLISMWFNNVSDAKEFIGTVLNAKRYVEAKYSQNIVVEYASYQTELTDTLRRYFTALKDDNKEIKNADAYLFTTFAHAFSEICEEELALNTH